MKNKTKSRSKSKKSPPKKPVSNKSLKKSLKKSKHKSLSKKVSYSNFTRNMSVKKNLNLEEFTDAFKAIKRVAVKLSKKQQAELLIDIQNRLIKNTTKDVGKLYKLYGMIVKHTDIDESIKGIRKCEFKSDILYSENLEGKCFKHYKLEKELGSGAYGKSYLVKDANQNKVIKMQMIRFRDYEDKPLPLKEICENLTKIFVEINHLKLGAKLGISPKYYESYICVDKLKSEVYHYIVMEHIDGMTLDDWVGKNKMTKEQGKDIIEMFNKLHKEGVVHSDLHGGNIMVTNDKKPKFYIIDYGLSQDFNIMISQEKKRSQSLFEDGYKKIDWTKQPEDKTFSTGEKIALYTLIEKS